ncbi:MAG: hypothetical protein GY859_16855 [Desulfobacterales bacterium]|nr:hypothetical protein [Desulfobacterales bacterium]
MDHIATSGYCRKCRKNVVIGRNFPEESRLYRILTLVTLGLWPLYLIRVGWHCTECGARVDTESPHIVGRKMGGFAKITDITSISRCPICDKDARVRRKLHTASTAHQILSFFTMGRWPLTWLRAGWTCDECGTPIPDEKTPTPDAYLEPGPLCKNYEKTTIIRRKKISSSALHRLLSLLTAGSWLFRWLAMGWRCVECGSLADDDRSLAPETPIESPVHCKHCGKETTAHRLPLKSSLFHRAFSFPTLGAWPFFYFRAGWRCRACGKRVKGPLFDPRNKSIY